MENPNILDVAKYAGVSKTTISNYLNNRFEKMSVETKERIAKAIEELKFVPNIGAQTLKKSRSGVICITVPYSYVVSELFFHAVSQGISNAASKSGYKILIYSSSENKHEEDAAYLKGLGLGMVDGFLVFDIQTNDIYVREFEENQFPYVCFGKLDNPDYTKYVCMDHEDGAYKSTNYLIDLGHRRIALLELYENLVVSQRIVNAYRRALLDRGVVYDPALVRFIGETDVYENIYGAVSEMFRLPAPPTAFYLRTTQVAVFMRVLKDLGKSVPGDYSVILSEYFTEDRYYEYRNFTHLQMPTYRLGYIAFEKLLQLIKGDAGRFEPVVLPVDLVVKESCRPI